MKKEIRNQLGAVAASSSSAISSSCTHENVNNKSINTVVVAVK